MEFTMNVYLVILSGGGDTYIKVVDQETYNWICSDDPGIPPELVDTGEEYEVFGTTYKRGPSSWVDQLVPASQIAKMEAEHKKYIAKWTIGNAKSDAFHPLQLSRGSWDNDRAIAACPADGYKTYSTVTEATKAIKKHGDVLEDEYQGCMY
jgi:hypothetical protein